MGNKFGRRYKRYQEKYADRFEALARRVIDGETVTMNVGVTQLIARLRSGDWLEILDEDSGFPSGASVSGRTGDDLVKTVADYLMIEVANRPGAQVPSLG